MSSPPRLLNPPDFSPDEVAAAVDFLMALKAGQIRQFLRQIEQPIGGNKSELRERIQNLLDAEDILPDQIVEFLDAVAPWGKQHVYLLSGPTGSITAWRDSDHVKQELRSARLGKYYNARLPLLLPPKLRVSCVEHTRRRLRVTAVEGRTRWERIDEYDESTTTPDGQEIELRAYERRVDRMLAYFDWNLEANTASIHITQLPSNLRYEEKRDEFTQLISWLPLSSFRMIHIHKAISLLHEKEKSGAPETRSHEISYSTPGGRRLMGSSPSAADSVLDERIVRDALEPVRKSGIGNTGNFYWLKAADASKNGNVLGADVHTILVAKHQRVNFPVANSEDAIRYVLSRIRELSK